MALGVWFWLLALIGPKGEGVLRSGPMVGYSEKREVMIWVQTTRAAEVRIKYWDRNKPKITAVSDAVQTRKDDDFTAHIRIGELEPGVHFNYDVVINGDVVAHTEPYAFQTQALFEYRTDPPDFTAALGSCLYINDSIYDRPGKPYGNEPSIMDRIADKQPDLMLWLGDNTYLREVDWNSLSGMLYRNRRDRGTKELKRLLAATHNYAIWDDHDYGWNDADRSYPYKDLSLNVFKMYWANPAYGMPDAPGTFFQFRWNDVDFFMLDGRYYRAPDDMEDGPDKTMLGKAQLQWLKDALLYSHAPFKVIVNGNQVLNEHTKFETMNFFKYERADLLTFIRKYKIPGVVFLSGDVHHTELLKTDDPEFYPLYDFTSSPFTSGLHAGDTDQANPQLVPGTKYTEGHSFGMLKFTGKRKERTMTMENYGETGKLIWSFPIHENDLKLKK